MRCDGECLNLCVKLPFSNSAALTHPFTRPAEYGLGKSGWVAARLTNDTAVPLELLKQSVDESYRAVAPKKLVASLPEEPLSS